ncbi:DUF4390 domain-containing protein [Pseudorhodoferax sp. Leaf267]|uniref:DUF4390 domain-containing protein n=1 Tax=Pseudorhodoferax sp. Leaf267 TaxID=1736316 RepID=UPI0006FA3931|nr:DUF4390 domain-containing protein [Pseudorhodoferax sp. Leaf267]KQP13529.1 hypothetical protein ASF43_16540 [Pseudorhodoferax sp. Leaf267]
MRAQPQAAPGSAEITELQLEHADGELLLSANVQFKLTEQVEDALHKGIPMFFVAEAELLRERWYWTDLKVASEARHMRLAYQPLTRRWRLNVGSRPIGNLGQGVALAQTFDSLAEALASVQRLSRWRIASVAGLPGDASSYMLRFRFALDVSQLPRPFQIGAVGQSEWNISASKTLQLGAEGAR